MRSTFLCSVASSSCSHPPLSPRPKVNSPPSSPAMPCCRPTSFIDAPADAPNDLKTSGKYTTGKRVDALGTVMGKSYERADRRVAADEGPAAAGPFRHQGDARRFVLGADRQRHGLALQLGRTR